MSGMKNGVLVAKNADYTQVDGPNPQSSESNGLILDNQVWLGSTSTNAGGTHINVTTLTAGTGVTLTRNTGVTPNTLTIAASASLANLYTADSGTATPSAGNLNVLTALGATNINNHPVSSTGSGSTLTLNWNNILPPTLAVSGTVNLTYLDYGVVCVLTASPVTVNLPQTGTTGISNGKMFYIASQGNTSSQNVTINAFAGDNINGLSSYVLNTNYQSVTLVYGTNSTWIII